jgi:hypothetical protein
LKVVIHDVVDHVIRVIVDHPAIVYMTGDLAGDTRRLLGLDTNTSLAFVLIILVPVLVLIVVVAVVVVVQGCCRCLVPVPVGVAEVAVALVWAPFPRHKSDLVQGRDGKVGVPPQVHRQEGLPPTYHTDAFWPFPRDRRNRHTVAIEMPLRR